MQEGKLESALSASTVANDHNTGAIPVERPLVKQSRENLAPHAYPEERREEILRSKEAILLPIFVQLDSSVKNTCVSYGFDV